MEARRGQREARVQLTRPILDHARLRWFPLRPKVIGSHREEIDCAIMIVS